MDPASAEAQELIRQAQQLVASAEEPVADPEAEAEAEAEEDEEGLFRQLAAALGDDFSEDDDSDAEEGPPPSVSERKAALALSSQFTFTPAKAVEFDFGVDVDSMLSRFMASSEAEQVKEMMAQVTAAKEQAEARSAAQLSALRTEFAQERADFEADLESAVDELMAVKQELQQLQAGKPATQGEGEPEGEGEGAEPAGAAGGGDAYAFDLGLDKVMAGIDANIGLAADNLLQSNETQKLAAELAAAQEELQSVRAEARTERARADAAGAELLAAQEAASAAEAAALQREAALRQQAESWVQEQHDAITAQAQEQLARMQEQFEQALQQERRPDRDGSWRTREEFVAIYGEETGEGGGSGRCPQWDATRSGGVSEAQTPQSQRAASGAERAQPSADALAPKSAEWWQSRNGRMLVEYTPSDKWRGHGAIPGAAGQRITIRSKDDPNWWMVTVGGVQGCVPASMVEVLPDDSAVDGPEQSATTRQMLQGHSHGRAGGKAKYAPYQGVVGVTIRGYLLKSASGRKEKWGADKSESSKKKLDWKRRYFVLNAADDPWIDYYKDEAAFLARASPKGTVRVRTATAAADAHTGGFTVGTRERNLHVRVEDPSSSGGVNPLVGAKTQEWIDHINRLAEDARARDQRVF